MDAFLGVTMRWLHIASVVVLAGGVFFARISGASILRYKPWCYGAILGLLASGLYNFLTKPSYPPGYHMWFGIKMLGVLHIFAATILLRDEKRRAMTGILIAAAIVVAISAWLRWISMR